MQVTPASKLGGESMVQFRARREGRKTGGTGGATNRLFVQRGCSLLVRTSQALRAQSSPPRKGKSMVETGQRWISSKKKAGQRRTRVNDVPPVPPVEARNPGLVVVSRPRLGNSELSRCVVGEVREFEGGEGCDDRRRRRGSVATRGKKVRP